MRYEDIRVGDKVKLSPICSSRATYGVGVVLKKHFPEAVDVLWSGHKFKLSRNVGDLEPAHNTERCPHCGMEHPLECFLSTVSSTRCPTCFENIEQPPAKLEM